MAATRVIGIGEALWDCFPDSRRPGGAPANVAYHATQLGLHGMVFSRVGDDVPGEELRKFLNARGVDTSILQRDDAKSTGAVNVSFDAKGQPQYEIQRDAAWDFLSWDDDIAHAVNAAHALCFGTLAQRCEVSRQTIQRAVAHARDEAIILYDVNLRQDFYDRAWIESSLAASTICKLNHLELETLGVMFGLRGEDTSTRARSLLDQFALDVVAVTRGDAGCILLVKGETIDVPGEPIDTVDPVGAGDAFTAGLLAGMLRGLSFASVARLANRVGGLVAARHGAMPNVSAEARAILASLRTR